MFGSGINPINFVSVHDVAVIVDHAVRDPTARGRALKVTGPHNVTMNELAGAVQSAAGRTSAPRHIPRAVLRLVAGTLGRAQPVVGRQLHAALAMDRLDLSAGASELPGPYERPTVTAAISLAVAPAPQDAR